MRSACDGSTQRYWEGVSPCASNPCASNNSWTPTKPSHEYSRAADEYSRIRGASPSLAEERAGRVMYSCEYSTCTPEYSGIPMGADAYSDWYSRVLTPGAPTEERAVQVAAHRREVAEIDRAHAAGALLREHMTYNL